MGTIYTKVSSGKIRLLVSCALIFSFSTLKAQRDMIRTNAGEEIRCRIIDETPVRFAFAYLKNGKPFQSEIFKNLVSDFKFNYFDEELPEADKLPKPFKRDPGEEESKISRTIKPNESRGTKRNKKVQANEAVVDSKGETESKIAVSSQQPYENENYRSKNPAETEPPRLSREQELSLQKEGTERTQSTLKDLSAAEKISKPVEEPLKSNATNQSEGVVSTSAVPANFISPYKWRIGIKGGIGNRLDNNLVTTNAYDSYLEQLLRGFTIGGDIAYFPRGVVGFGVIYTDFRSSNSEDNLTYRNIFTNTELIGNISNNRSVKFVGPALFLRKKLDFKSYVVLGLSPGYNFYTDKGSYDLENYTVKGSGFGAATTLGIDFLLGNEINGRNIILSFEAGYSYGKIDQLDYDDNLGLTNAASPIDVGRLDFTVGLRFIRWPWIR